MCAYEARVSNANRPSAKLFPVNVRIPEPLDCASFVCTWLAQITADGFAGIFDFHHLFGPVRKIKSHASDRVRNSRGGNASQQHVNLLAPGPNRDSFDFRREREVVG